jgi:hypothetical protein
MDITEISPTIAEIAVAIAGFSAIVVVLRKRPIRDWHAYDRFNFRMLLQVAALTIIFSIFPFGALAIVDSPVAWKISLLTYGFVHLLDVSSFIVFYPHKWNIVNKIAASIGVLIALAQIGSGFFASEGAMQVVYLMTLVWHLAISSLGFVLLVYMPGVENESS